MVLTWLGNKKPIFDGTPVVGSMSNQKEKYDDEDLEEIMDRHAPKGQIGVAELRQMIRDNPLLVGGLLFTFGLLLGVSYRSNHRK